MNYRASFSKIRQGTGASERYSAAHKPRCYRFWAFAALPGRWTWSLSADQNGVRSQRVHGFSHRRIGLFAPSVASLSYSASCCSPSLLEPQAPQAPLPAERWLAPGTGSRVVVGATRTRNRVPQSGHRRTSAFSL